MRFIRASARIAAILIGELFVVASILAMIGVWWVERSATEIALNVFELVEGGVRVVDAGVARVDDLLSTSRTEVRQAAETFTTVGSRAETNRPVLRALCERLETSLAPRTAQIQQALTPARDAVSRIANAVTVLNALPFLADRAPRLAALDESFDRLESLTLDTTQLRSTLRALIDAQTSELSQETIATINGLTQRIDSRLGEVQANTREMQAEIDALQVRQETRKNRLLLAFHRSALIATLLLAWIVYSQIIVIRHRRPETK